MELPDDVIILEEKYTEKGVILVELPLSKIPDHVASQIRDGISFVKGAQAEGNNGAGSFRGYHEHGKYNGRFTSYRVVLKGSWGASNL